jgi:hypothetical protein
MIVSIYTLIFITNMLGYHLFFNMLISFMNGKAYIAGLIICVLLGMPSLVASGEKVLHFASLTHGEPKINVVSKDIIINIKEKPLYHDLIQAPEEYKEHKDHIHSILQDIPEEHLVSLKKLALEIGEHKRRGLASFRSIYLGVDAIESEQELRRVLIHEIGHLVDLGVLKGKKGFPKSSFQDGSKAINITDPSLNFYSLCWETSYLQKNVCNAQDFVSEYAQTDVFEDFAESYLLFTENNESFLRMAEESAILQSKYDFLAQVVFYNEFERTAASKELALKSRVWDLTRVF